MPPRRKKWTEEEERTLIDKYGDMVSDGTLAKMKTREKRFKPIAAQVNSLHHSRDPIAFPWQWTWKDASTKVQNMRHQYLLVKQKIKRPATATAATALGSVAEEDVEKEEEFDWVEGVSHWPNFLRYKSVFGDHPLGGFGNPNGVNCVNGGSDLMDRGFGGGGGGGGGGRGVDVVNGDDHRVKEDGGEEGIELEEGRGRGRFAIEEEEEEVEGVERRAWAFLANQFGELREREGRFEEREGVRERERRRREQVWLERERERERRMEEWERERGRGSKLGRS
ncbi:hypothetical protein Sjap_008986 [Stephania japonica]|uniref:Uncharacterized protein n=1 Tax=Stephania japonica TaxID=461633 RepID=A0AAP0JT01_9MAGN